MKQTNLQLVQTIMSSMDSDEVNSVNDTVESQQVLKVIRTVYFDIVTRLNLPEHYALFNLNPSGDANKPVLMTVPDEIEQFFWVKYNGATAEDTEVNFMPVEYVELSTFIDQTDRLNTSDDDVSSMTHSANGSTTTFKFNTNRAPQCYTTINDTTLIFDSYDSQVDTTLQSSKTKCYGKRTIAWADTDSFIPELDADKFPLLLSEAKSLAWAELKQTSHAKAEQSARRGWVRAQKTKYRTETTPFLDQLPNFGRK